MREIYVYDTIGIDGITADAFRRQLPRSPYEPVVVRINSPGGDPFDGLTIHTLLSERPNVTVKIDGIAASAASIIAMAGDVVEMAEAGLLMIHDAQGITIGNAIDHRDFADVLDTVDGQMARVYQKKTGQPLPRIRFWMDAETWMTAEEAMELGFIDAVASVDATGAPTARFNPAKVTASCGGKNAPRGWREACRPRTRGRSQADARQEARRRTVELYGMAV